MKNTVDEINNYISDNHAITIKREAINDYKLYGFPLFINENILIMTQISDFRDDGVIALNTDDISDVYADGSESLQEQICKKEGLNNKENPFPNCNCIHDVLSMIDTSKKFVIIECEKNEDLAFSIGKIIDISSEEVKMEIFDADGIWEPDAVNIPIKEITSIQIDDNYSKTYYKYMNK